MYRMSLSTTATFGTATLERSQGLRHLNGYGSYTVTHHTAGSTTLFLQPSGHHHQSYYEAPFNLLR